MSFKKSVPKKVNLGNTIQTSVTVTKTGNNKNIEGNELTKLYKEFEKNAIKADPNAQICVYASTPLQDYWNLKGYQDDDLRFEDYDEYFVNRVKDESKFEKFTDLTFIVKVTNNNKKAYF